jgi:hypothetical protein
MALSNQSGTFFLYLAIPYLCPDDANTTLADALLHCQHLNYALTAFSALNVIMFYVHFPSHPPNAPSLSANSAQIQESKVLSVLKQRNFISCAYAPRIFIIIFLPLFLGFADFLGLFDVRFVEVMSQPAIHAHHGDVCLCGRPGKRLICTVDSKFGHVDVEQPIYCWYRFLALKLVCILNCLARSLLFSFIRTIFFIRT